MKNGKGGLWLFFPVPGLGQATEPQIAPKGRAVGIYMGVNVN